MIFEGRAEGLEKSGSNADSEEPEGSVSGLLDMLFGNVSEDPEDETSDGDGVEGENHEPCSHDVATPFIGGPSISIELTSSGAVGGADGDFEEFDIEDDPSILMAVYDALSTPATVEAEDDAVIAVMNVQESCAADFEKLCDASSEESVGYARMPSLSSDILNIFDSMHGTFMDPEPSGNLLFFRRRLMEAEYPQEKYSDGLKMMRQLRDRVVPMKLFRAPDAARRRLTSHAGSRPAKVPRRTKDSLEAEDRSSPEKVHRKAELEKLFKMRAEYNGNPNRSKLSTRLSHTPSTVTGSRKLSSQQFHGPPPKGKPGPGPGQKPKPGPGNSHGPPPKAKPKPGPGMGRSRPGPVQPPRSEDNRWMRYAGPRLADLDDDDDEDEDEDEDEDDDEGEEYAYGQHGAGRLHAMGKPWLQDDVYSGSLGYGEDGDTCMYSQYPKLSADCKGAISDLYDFRDDYFAETQTTMMHPYHRHHHGFLIFMVVLTMVFGVVAWKRRQKTKQIRKILDVIDSNPNLKSQVEQLAGCEIPEHNSGWNAMGSSVRGVVSGSCKLAGLIFASLFVVVTSILITCAILAAMSEPPEDCREYEGEDGEDPCARRGPGVLVALLILFGVASLEVYLLYGLAVSLKCFNTRATRAAPPSQSEGGSMLGGFLPRMGTSDSGTGDYVALSGTEGAALQQEMSHLGASSPTVLPDQQPAQYSTPVSKQQQQQQQRLPQGVVTGTPVSAVPVSAINYI